MLAFFPQIAEEETLYSVLARYHSQTGHRSPKHTLGELFGSVTAAVSIDLPGRLGALAEKIDSPLLTVDTLIDHHTNFRLYAAFMPASHARSLRARMRRAGDAGDLLAFSGLMAGGLPACRLLKACRQCCAEDRKAFGFACWKRLHQVSGIDHCWIHHLPLLQFRPGRWALIELTQQLLSKMRPATILARVDGHDRVLMDLALKILQSRSAAIPYAARISNYLASLDALGLRSKRGSIRWRELVPNFTEFWGSVRLRARHSEIPSGRYSHWLATLLHRRPRTSHPVRNLMLQVFLDGNATLPAPADPQVKPFGNAPWPCLNPVCKHYRRMVIQRVTLSDAIGNGACTGLFEHHCGFAYRRIGPDPQRRQVYRKDQVVRFGNAWEDRCAALVTDRGLSWRAISRSLQADVKTIQARARGPKRSAGTSVDVGALQTRWQQLQIEHPAESVTELRRREPSLYARLYRCCPDWLVGAAWPAERSIRPARVDWAARDRYLSRRVPATARALRRCQAPLRRLSRTLIAATLDARALVEQHLDRLPKTSAALSRCVESPAEFRQRRLWAAYKYTIAERRPLTRSNLLWRARIRPEFVGDVENLLDLVIKGASKQWRHSSFNGQKRTDAES